MPPKNQSAMVCTYRRLSIRLMQEREDASYLLVPRLGTSQAVQMWFDPFQGHTKLGRRIFASPVRDCDPRRSGGKNRQTKTGVFLRVCTFHHQRVLYECQMTSSHVYWTSIAVYWCYSWRAFGVALSGISYSLYPIPVIVLRWSHTSVAICFCTKSGVVRVDTEG